MTTAHSPPVPLDLALLDRVAVILTGGLRPGHPDYVRCGLLQVRETFEGDYDLYYRPDAIEEDTGDVVARVPNEHTLPGEQFPQGFSQALATALAQAGDLLHRAQAELRRLRQAG